jgi:hypothetical protein
VGFLTPASSARKINFNTTTVLFAGCTSIYSSEYGSTVVPARDEQDLNITTVTGVLIMWGQPISIGFQRDDVTLFTTGTATVTYTGAATAQRSDGITQSTSGPTGSGVPTSSPDSGLSTGAKAGIGIAAAVGAFAVLTAMGFVFLRRRKAMKPLRGQITDNGDQWQRKELDGSPYRGELPDSLSRQELGRIDH